MSARRRCHVGRAAVFLAVAGAGALGGACGDGAAPPGAPPSLAVPQSCRPGDAVLCYSPTAGPCAAHDDCDWPFTCYQGVVGLCARQPPPMRCEGHHECPPRTDCVPVELPGGAHTGECRYHDE